MNDRAIVTVAIGEPYFSNWKKYCATSWYAYANKHQLDVIVIREPLDRSPRAQARSPAWQKCLVLSQPNVAHYQQVVLLDSDIVINAALSPDITRETPLERIGGVLAASHIPEDLRVILLHHLRGLTYPYDRGLRYWREDQRAYYQNYGFSSPPDAIVQTGVLVASPVHHRDLFLEIYSGDYGEENRAYEQIPLSYEIIRRDLFWSLDSRFNSVFYETMLIYYPSLVNKSLPDFEVLARYATRVQLLNNFFLHFAYDADFMRYLFDKSPSS